ncbi:hypothetical protein UFOVP245_101 [uncultured Caudovirales phage]|uniref:Uncharacterized protein n=1 Tax=uncultured Caudovirales phage TaxID=2100421 RepID=A0A6J7X1Q6_9CAUD|nr:hypothetical protein UFOVP245_101 [uncultured Caudovirales phage]
MTVAARLSSSGDYSVLGELDEVTQSNASVTEAYVYASEFDEVTLNPISAGIAKRETFDGKVLIAGTFDEMTFNG